jgi:hypothetical protein
MGVLEVVFLILLVLKLAGIGSAAAWSWWVVCSPLLADVAILVLAITLYFML